MFTELQQAHQSNVARLRDATEQAKREALGSLAQVAHHLVESANGGVHTVFVREKEIELEVRQLTATVQNFKRQQQQWRMTFAAFDDALKELGDVENWLQVMDYDFQVVAGTIQRLAQTQAAGADMALR
eukprot:TRINITY_DN1349_c0_g1_i2.p1 TRINITY_DN1349_c0_g1~~TRINITY_DN1349_c0_g1_i2.p1  ORF type:complete len:129 (-),score=39.87 TRINITY_DN1349_c0_g1_i2:1095-1481(-)